MRFRGQTERVEELVRAEQMDPVVRKQEQVI